MAGKFSIATRQGRARRANRPDLFNPDTLLPHGKGVRKALRDKKEEDRKAARHSGLKPWRSDGR